jgi:tetratricopeptide (TPR) repeat protein
LNRSLAIAEEHSDVPNIAGLLGMLHMYHLRGGDFRTALQHAEHSSKVAGRLGDAGMTALAHALLGISRHLMGDLAGAHLDLEKAVEPGSAVSTGRLIYFGFDYHSWASVALATTLWLRGYPAQASACAHRAIADAERIDHPVSLAIVLAAITVLLSTDEMQAAEQHLDWFISRAGTRSFGPYFDVGQGLKGELAIRRGDVEAGVSILRDCLERLHAARYERFTTRFHLMIARGLAGSGRHAEAVTLVDETIGMVEAGGGTTYSPELLRLKGSFLLSMPIPRIEDAEGCFTRSLELSRRQGARAWELRTATDLAALWAKQGHSDDAQALLRPVFAQFTEGSGTVDFKAAEQLLAILS